MHLSNHRMGLYVVVLTWPYSFSIAAVIPFDSMMPYCHVAGLLPHAPVERCMYSVNSRASLSRSGVAVEL
jgi:hypothetical protein